MAFDWKAIAPAFAQLAQNAAAIHHPGGAMNIQRLDAQRNQQALLALQLEALKNQKAMEDAKMSRQAEFTGGLDPLAKGTDGSPIIWNTGRFEGGTPGVVDVVRPEFVPGRATPTQVSESAIPLPGGKFFDPAVAGDIQSEQMATLRRAFAPQIADAQVKSMFRDPKDNFIASGGNLYNVSDPNNPQQVGTGAASNDLVNVLDRTKPNELPRMLSKASATALINTDPDRYALAGTVSAATDPAIQKRADMLMETGVPENIAKGIAAGRYVTSVNPVDQSHMVMDVATGQPVGKLSAAVNLPADDGGAPGAPPAPAEPQNTLVPPGMDAGEATGLSGMLKGTINTVTDAFGAGLAFPRANRASESLSTIALLTKTLLQDNIPGRPSNYLMEEISKVTVQPNSVLRGEESARERLEQTRNLIAEEVARIDRDILSKPGQFRPEVTQQTQMNKSQLEQLLGVYDQMVEGLGRRSKANRPPLSSFERSR